MERSNRWRIRDEEEYEIALAYLRRSFLSERFWKGYDKTAGAKEELERFADKPDEKALAELTEWIYAHLDEERLRRLRTAMRVGKSRNRHRRTQVTLDVEVHEALRALSQKLGLNLSQTIRYLLKRCGQSDG